MHIIYIILFLFWKCSFLQDERVSPEKYNPVKNGNLILRIEDDDFTIPNVQIQASEFPPELYYASSYSPSVFFLLPMKSAGYLFPTVQKNLKLELKTDLQTNRDYSFYLPAGNYFMNITNHSEEGLNFPVFLDRNIPKIINLSFGFKVREETEFRYSVENYSGNCIHWNRSNDTLNFLNASRGSWCKGIKISEDKITILKIKREKLSLDLMSSFLLWMPGIMFLVPFYYGHSLYEIQYSADILY